MNAARKAFLARNTDPSLQRYIKANHEVAMLRHYTSTCVIKNRQETVCMAQPYTAQGTWINEDKLAFQSFADIEFFAQWLSSTHNTPVALSSL